MKKPVEEMSLDEVLHEVAILTGWTPPETDIPTGPGTSWPQDVDCRPLRFPHWLRVVNRIVEEWGPRENPIAQSLDTVAALMPEGWTWEKFDGGWWAWISGVHTSGPEVYVPVTVNETLDRFRLLLLILRKEQPHA